MEKSSAKTKPAKDSKKSDSCEYLDNDGARRGSDERNAVNLTNLNSAITKLIEPSDDWLRGALRELSTTEPTAKSILLSLPQEGKYVGGERITSLLDYVYETATGVDKTNLLRKLGESQILDGLEEKALLALGPDFITFLKTLSSVFHSHSSAFLYPETTEKEKEKGKRGKKDEERGEGGYSELRLRLVTKSSGSAHFLHGSLINISKRLYHFESPFQMVEDGMDTFSFILEDDSGYDEACSVPSLLPEDLPIGVSTFCETLPWHFIIDEDLEIVQLGTGFTRLIGHEFVRLGTKLTTYFDIVSPRDLPIHFGNIKKRTNSHFVIKHKDSSGEGLEVKGEMVYCRESNTLLFVGSPCADGLESLNSKGLFISDIPLHDATRDVILVGEQARAQDGLRRRMDKLKRSIEEASDAVLRERERNVQLLHLIFPPDIAERLWLGQTIEAKTYQSVTMLFSDIVGFTSICSTATPFMVCNMLERIYKQFDTFCDLFDVYKVETIGDAYCVAAGIQKPDDSSHAQRIAWMAMSMIDVCPTHCDHEGKKIQMRIGLHTGTVLAGVVGVKMPRYCLFGHNVTLTNKFESGSEPLRINISPTTYKHLKDKEGFTFEARERNCLPKEFPPDIPGTCHFLLGYRHPQLDPSAPLLDHIRKGAESLGLCKEKPEVKVDYNPIDIVTL